MMKDKLRLWQTASPQVRSYSRDCYIHKYFWNGFKQSCWRLFRNCPGPSGPEEQWHLHRQLQGVLGSPGVWCGALSTHLDTHRRRREQWGVHVFLMCCYTFILSLEGERKSPGNLWISWVIFWSVSSQNGKRFFMEFSHWSLMTIITLYKVLYWSMLKLNIGRVWNNDMLAVFPMAKWSLLGSDCEHRRLDHLLFFLKDDG